MRKNKNYLPGEEQITHVKEILALLAAVTNDERYTKAYYERKDGKERKTMCEYLDRIVAEGKAEGKAEGADRINSLNRLLIQKGRQDDLLRSVVDVDYQNQLLKEFQL